MRSHAKHAIALQLVDDGVAQLSIDTTVAVHRIHLNTSSPLAGKPVPTKVCISNSPWLDVTHSMTASLKQTHQENTSPAPGFYIGYTPCHNRPNVPGAWDRLTVCWVIYWGLGSYCNSDKLMRHNIVLQHTLHAAKLTIYC